MKKGSLIVSTIIVLVIIAATFLIVSVVSSTVFGGISILWHSENPCKSVTDLTSRISSACEYNYPLRAELNIGEHGSRKGDSIIRLPQSTDNTQKTGYHPEINPEYTECRGGVCLCLTKSNISPPPAKCRFCNPIAQQSLEPAFCCDYGVCEFENIATIPNPNGKFVSVSSFEPDQKTKIFDGLRFVLENKTENITWLREFCNHTIYAGNDEEGVFIIDYNETDPDTNRMMVSGCCFREDRLVSSCLNKPLQAKNKSKLVKFVNLSKGKWPLKGRTALNITKLEGIGGVDLRKTKFKIWWR